MVRLAFLFCFLASSAFAQSNPGWVNGQVHSADEYNALWAGKLDVGGAIVLSSPTPIGNVVPNTIAATTLTVGGNLMTFPTTPQTLPGLSQINTFTKGNVYTCSVADYPCWSTSNIISPVGSDEQFVTTMDTTLNLTQDTTAPVLALRATYTINAQQFNYGVGADDDLHSGPGYFQNRSFNTLPLAGCTPGINCPGVVQNATALVAFAYNRGTGPLRRATNFEAHNPIAGNLTSGGSTDIWTVLHAEPCVSGIDAGLCAIIRSAGHMGSGFGTENPMALVHARAINTTGTATGSISDGSGSAGTVLLLTSPPTNPAGLSANCTVSGAGVTAKTYIVGTSPNPTGLGVTFRVNNSQLIASETLTLTCTEMPIIAQNISGDASYFLIAQSSGTEPTGYITQHFDGTLGQEWRIGNGGRDSGTSIVITRHGGLSAAAMGIGYGDTEPNQSYSIDANGAINAVGGFFSNNVAGADCSAPGVGFVSVKGLFTVCPAPNSGVVPVKTVFTTTTAGVAIPAGATFIRFIVQGQGGCGGAGAGITTPFTGAGGAAGGGSSPKDTGWFPTASLSGTITFTIGTPCTGPTGAAIGATGGNGSVGANATVAVTGMTTLVSFGGGGGNGAVGGAGNTATGGGGGSGTIAVGGSATTATGGGGGSIGGTAGGSGVAAASDPNFLGASGGGGGAATGAAGSSSTTVGGSTGGGAGGGCNTGTPAVGAVASIPLSTTTTNGGSTSTTGGTGPAATANIGAGGGGGGGGSTTVGGPGGPGGAGGGGGGGGGSGCGAAATGGAGGVGGQPQIAMMSL